MAIKVYIFNYGDYVSVKTPRAYSYMGHVISYTPSPFSDSGAFGGTYTVKLATGRIIKAHQNIVSRH